MTLSIHRGYLPGCIGRITELHAGYYSAHAGFGLPFEAKVARELAAFCEAHEPQRDGFWLAHDDQGVQASLVVDGHPATDGSGEGAHLRWFISSATTRGSGIGRQLLGQAMAFCRERGYPRAYLWTFEGLDAARHLYEQAGFRLVLSQRGSQWGREVNEQRFEWRAQWPD